jgi:hypothetical protein
MAVADTPKCIAASGMSLIFKTVPNLIQPLSLIWLVLGLWLFRRVIKQRGRGVLAPGSAWLLLTVLTCTPLSSYLLAGLENQVPKVKLAELPHVQGFESFNGWLHEMVGYWVYR